MNDSYNYINLFVLFYGIGDKLADVSHDGKRLPLHTDTCNTRGVTSA